MAVKVKVKVFARNMCHTVAPEEKGDIQIIFK